MIKYNYSKNNHCKCDKLITNNAKMCSSCAHKGKKRLLFSEKWKRKMSKSQKRRNNPYKFKKGRIPWNKNLSRSKETKKKISLSKGGTGIPYEFSEYSLEFAKQLKESIRQRDNYTCQKCGIIEKEYKKIYNRILDVHHIDYDKENCDKDNLISLCRSCNDKVNSNRDYWYAYFVYIIEKRNKNRKNFIYKINDKITHQEIKSFFNKMDKKTRKELYFSVRNPYKEIKAIKNSDIITARIKENKKCLGCKGGKYRGDGRSLHKCPDCRGTGKLTELVGIARVVSDKNYYFYATDFMVIPSYRKMGIATEMMKRVVKYCKKKGFIKIFLVPVKGLEKFYSKFGFKISSYPQMNILQKGISNG